MSEALSPVAQTPDSSLKAEPAAPVRLTLLGDLTLVETRASRNLTPKSRKARAVLAYLALNGPVRRERLAGLLWGDKAHEQARASLRQAVAELTAIDVGGLAVIDAGRESLSLRRGMIRIDCDEILDAALVADLAALHVAVDGWDGGVAADLDGLGEEADDWLAAMREATRTRLVSATLDAGEAHLTAHNARTVAASAARLVAIDPYNERALRLGMAASAAAGDTAEASRRYRAFEARLKAELGVAPSEATRRQHLTLTGDKPDKAPAPPTPDGAGAPAAAAVRLGGGMSMAPRWAIAVTLGAAVLTTLWVLTRPMMAKIPAPGPQATVHPLAFGAPDAQTLLLYQQGRDAMTQRTRVGRVQALALLHQAVERSPSFSRGWSALAFAQILAANTNDSTDGVQKSEDWWLRQARVSVERALALDPRNGDAYLASSELVDDNDQSLRLLNQGVGLDPDNGGLIRARGMLWFSLGYDQRALADIRRAIQLDPADPRAVSMLHSILLQQGKVDEARQVLGEGLRRFPLYPHLWRKQLVALLAQHRFAEARFMLSPTNIQPDKTFLGPVAELRQLVRAYETHSPSDIAAAVASQKAAGDDPLAIQQRVWRLALLGKTDAAYQVIADHRSEQLHGAGRGGAQLSYDRESFSDAPLETFRHDPRFLGLWLGTGTYDYWRRTKSWPDACRAPGGWPDCPGEIATIERQAKR